MVNWGDQCYCSLMNVLIGRFQEKEPCRNPRDYSTPWLQKCRDAKAQWPGGFGILLSR